MVRIAVLCGLACLWACGSSGHGGGADAGGDGGAVDAGVLGDASAPDAGTNLGFVTLQSDPAPPASRSSVTFLTGGPAYNCSQQAAGACTLYRCTPRPGAGATPAPHAGLVRVDGTSQALRFTPDADGTYPVSVLASTSLWSGGETLTVTAAGAMVPGFTGTVTAPHTLTLTGPSVPSGDWTLPRSQDLVLTWSGGSSETVVVTFGANTVDPLELECVFPASAGTGTVSAAGLGLLPAGDGYYSALGRMRSELTAGSWDVTLRADSDLVLPGGVVATGSAVFQ